MNPGSNRVRDGLGQMTEFERLLHLFVSLQILFGSRRGGIGIPILLLVLFVGGWFAYKAWFDSAPALERADAKWDSGDTQQRIEAIRDYKILLKKKDPLESELMWLKSGRDRLYRRIIEYHVLFDIDKPAARDWIYDAWLENIRDIDFHDKEVNDFWKLVTDEIKEKQKSMGPLGPILKGK